MRAADIARRKAALIALSGIQREAVGLEFRRLEPPVRMLERGYAVLRFCYSNPWIVAAAVLVIYARRARGGGLLRLAGRALTLWRLWRSVSALRSGRLAW